MKKLVVFLSLVFVLAFVSASVEVHDYDLKKVYLPFGLVEGEINLTIAGEEFGADVVSNNGGKVKLGDFLKDNGVIYFCSPPDCSDDYEVLKSGKNMTFVVPSVGVVYGEFVLRGNNVEVNGIDFNLSSDFVESSNLPIAIDFFEGSEWEFGEFSDEYSGENWGCYNPTAPVVGPPIRKSVYCEMITISDSDALYLGADVDDGDSVNLKMSIYPELGGNELGSCLFNPGAVRGCVVNADAGEIFSAGDYQVCVQAPDGLSSTNYKLFQENTGAICGFVYSLGPGTGSEDYAIFVKEAKYAPASSLSPDDFDFESLVVAADSLVEKKYNRNCSDGCVLPFVISGIAQNVLISNVVVESSSYGDNNPIEEVSFLEILPATVDFSGVLDLGVLGFNVSSGDMVYEIFLGDNELLSEKISVLPAPIISSVSPLNPPAGVPVEFRALVQFDGNKSLSYKWNFGDGGVASTDKPAAVHTYGKLGNYSMTVEVSAGGNLTTKKVFAVTAISPRVAVNESLLVKRKYLDDIVKVIGVLPSWYAGALSKAINVDYFDSELKRLDKARNGSVNDEGFVKIAGELYALDVPVGLVHDSYSSPDLMTDIDEIDIAPIVTIGGAGSGDNDDYKSPILAWQSSYIAADVLATRFAILKASGEREFVFNVYDIDLASSDFVESYFVINKPKGDLFFKENVGEREVDGVTVVTLGAEGKKSLAFYYEGESGVSFFVSPKLSSIVIESDIDRSCNFNLVCEEGEDYVGCRSDCKPVGRAIFYGFLILIGVLVLYSLLQVWYKVMYEGYLFSDHRQLYNLLMYVTNARARGMEDLRIRAELRSKGWSSERVDYIIKKSRGQRVGMIEIIPISKIGAWLRNRKARKNVELAREQIGRNINKSEFQW
ncbi:MAG: PKD domain-containing protein [archaeon]